MFKNMLISTDASDLAEKAIPVALEQAKLNGARVTAVMVIDLTPYIMAIEALPTGIEGWEEALHFQAQIAVKKIADAAQSAGVQCDMVIEKDPVAWRGILTAAARQGCDIIVMSSHGRSAIPSALLGSQTTGVLAHSKIPVLVIR